MRLKLMGRRMLKRQFEGSWCLCKWCWLIHNWRNPTDNTRCPANSVPDIAIIFRSDRAFQLELIRKAVVKIGAEIGCIMDRRHRVHSTIQPATTMTTTTTTTVSVIDNPLRISRKLNVYNAVVLVVRMQVWRSQWHTLADLRLAAATFKWHILGRLNALFRPAVEHWQRICPHVTNDGSAIFKSETDLSWNFVYLSIVAVRTKWFRKWWNVAEQKQNGSKGRKSRLSKRAKTGRWTEGYQITWWLMWIKRGPEKSEEKEGKMGAVRTSDRQQAPINGNQASWLLGTRWLWWLVALSTIITMITVF